MLFRSSLKAQKSKYSQMLEASKEFKTNQVSNYQLLSAVNQTVPGGVWFTTIAFDSPNSLVIKGEASNDQVIGSFIERLQRVPMIERASLQNMTLNAGPVQRKGGGAKQFEVRCIVTNTLAPVNPPQSLRPVVAPTLPRPTKSEMYI